MAHGYGVTGGVADNHGRTACLFARCFLGGGSVNKPESDYHLEFMTSNQHFADEIVRVLRLFHIVARVTERKDPMWCILKKAML